MRSLWVRCLVLLLAFALSSGNAPAAGHYEPCPEHGAHAAAGHEHHRHRHGAAETACCCDCLGCVAPAILLPAGSATPIDVAGMAVADGKAAILSSRALPPDPDPPRSPTLS